MSRRLSASSPLKSHEVTLDFINQLLQEEGPTQLLVEKSLQTLQTDRSHQQIQGQIEMSGQFSVHVRARELTEMRVLGSVLLSAVFRPPPAAAVNPAHLHGLPS